MERGSVTFSLIVVILQSVCLLPSTAVSDFDGCNTIVYTENGQFSAAQTLQACAAQMASPLLPITSDIRFNGSLTAVIQLGINNLISVNEVDSVIEVDFYFRITWTDPRWKMNDTFWAEQNELLPIVGMEIFYLTQNEHVDDNLPVWIPDMWFQDQLGFEVHASTLKLYKDASFFFSRHCTLTLKQAQLNLEKYPLDTQFIDFKLNSWGLDASQVKIKFDDPPITYLVDEQGEFVFTKHPIWGHTVGQYVVTTYVDTFLLNSYEVKYDTIRLQVQIDRLGNGILMRYALPILFLLVLAGLTFWANFETRIDTTMTILLSVSALYVVILGGIPQVGYLTEFDQWIFSMFIMLSVCVFAHQVVVNSFRKVDAWPFRAVIIRSIELTGRIVVIPLSVALFTTTFNSDEIEYELKIMKLVFFTIFGLVLVREMFGVRKSVRLAMRAIGRKVDLAEKKCSWAELGALNLYHFRTINFTTIPYEAKRKREKRMELEKSDDNVGNNVQSKTMSRQVSKSRTSSLLMRAFRNDALYDSDDEL